jgi:hypothetical protein
VHEETRQAIEGLAVKAGDLAVAAERLWDESGAEKAETAADALREAEQKLLAAAGSRLLRR